MIDGLTIGIGAHLLLARAARRTFGDRILRASEDVGVVTVLGRAQIDFDPVICVLDPSRYSTRRR